MLYAISKINFLRFIRLYDRKSKNIIWIHFDLNRIKRPDIGFIYDICFILYFLENKKNFRIVNTKNIGRIHDSIILINLSRSFNTSNYDDWGGYLHRMIGLLENQNNVVSPSYHESEFWENKIFMYEQFSRKNINYPVTKLLSEYRTILNEMKFPLITKIPHGAGSMGIEEIVDKEQLQKVYEESTNPNKIIIQERINMKMDARVVILGFEYFDHYFRVNQSDKWHPTSTSKGSKLEYYDLTDEVKHTLIRISKELNLRCAAYDVCWENNDFINGKPLILEVSPAYLPNPRYTGNLSYKVWKKKIFNKNPYWKANVDNLIWHRKKLASVYINSKNDKI